MIALRARQQLMLTYCSGGATAITVCASMTLTHRGSDDATGRKYVIRRAWMIKMKSLFGFSLRLEVKSSKLPHRHTFSSCDSDQTGAPRQREYMFELVEYVAPYR